MLNRELSYGRFRMFIVWSQNRLVCHDVDDPTPILAV